MKMRRWARNIGAHILLGIFGLFVGFVMVETGLRLLPRDLLNSVTEGSTRLQLYRLDPRMGWSLRPNAHSVHMTREDEAIPINTNSLGLRDTEHTYSKPPGTYRILMLGDSFTEALDVKLRESFPYLVEQCLNQKLEPPIEVISAGVSGYGAAEQYLFYINEGIKYNPDLVLLVFYVGNDFTDLERSDRDRLVRGFGGYRFTLEENGSLNRTWISWEYPYNEQVSPMQLFLRRYSLAYRILMHPESKIYWNYQKKKEELLNWLQFNNRQQSALRPIPWSLYIHIQDFSNNPIVPEHLKDIWNLFKIIIGQLNTTIKSDDDQLTVVIIPTEYQAHQAVRQETIEYFAQIYDFTAQYEQAWRTEEPDQTMTKYLQSQQIPTLDLLPYFKSHDEAGGASLYFEGGFPQHLNKDGQTLVGNIICDWLIQNRAIRLPRP